MAEKKFLDGNGLKIVKNDYTTKIGKKVDAEDGKSLIETTKIEKLDGIEDGAQKNNITKVQVNGSDQTIGEDGTLNIDVEGKLTTDGFVKNDALESTLEGYVKEEGFDEKVKGVVGPALVYQGAVENFEALPQELTEADKGKFYDVQDTGANYAWNGTEWDKLSENIDISGKADKTELPEALSQEEIEAVLNGD